MSKVNSLFSNALLVSGTDGITPVYNPDGNYHVWNYNEVYFHGGVGKGKYVPKVGDKVDRYMEDTLIQYLVIAIDDITMHPTLRELGGVENNRLDKGHILTRTGLRCRDDTYRVYLDDSVVPHTLAVDTRFSVRGSHSSYVKIFMGHKELGKEPVCISAIYDHRNQLITENVPLEMATLDNHTNRAVYTVKPCHTRFQLPDGEFVLVCVYNDDAQMIAKREMVIENTSAIPQPDTKTKYIIDMELDTEFLSSNELNTLLYPINVQVSGLNLFGKIHYSDGTTMRLPVDGTKFTVLGLRDYIASVPGSEFNFTLRYILGPNENAYGGLHSNVFVNLSNKEEHFLTRNYKAKTGNRENHYSVKLFAYPDWINEDVGWMLRFFIYNMDRSEYKEVTNFIRYNQNLPTFNGKLYNENQRISVSLNLKNVGLSTKTYFHTQVLDVQLNAPATDNSEDSYWSIASDINVLKRVGERMRARLTATGSRRLINLNIENLTKEQWLKKVYFDSLPLIHPEVEVKPIEPTHFMVSYFDLENGLVKRKEKVFGIELFNTDLTLDVLSNNHVVENSLVMVHFLKGTSLGSLHLGCNGFILKRS